MNNISIMFRNPWLLLLIIPLIAIAVFPYFRLPKKHRKTRNRITSMVIHIIILILLTTVLSGLKIQNNYVARKNDIMILVDHSASQIANQEETNQFIKSVADTLPTNYRMGIIEFGRDSLYTVKMNTNAQKVYESYLNNDKVPNGSGTDIYQALLYAQKQLDHAKKGRIILISDGRQTDNNALVAAKTVSDSGTRIDVKYITPKRYVKDAQIKHVFMPEHINRGVETNITVAIESDTEGPATLEVTYKNQAGELILDSQDILLDYGTSSYTFQHIFSELGLTEIKVNLVVGKEIDTVPENNIYYTFANLSDVSSNKILIIEGNQDEGMMLQQVLSGTGYQVNRVGISQLPKSLNELTQYQEIILANVKNSDLTKTGFQILLDSYVRNYGGGLLTVGGNRAYQQQDMAGAGVDRTFDQLLPVDSNTDPKSMAVVIVMDASGSMTSNGSNKFALAKAGAKASVKALYDNKGETSHMFGLVTFDANQKDVIEMTSVNNIDSIQTRIDSLQTGLGTHYIQGLRKAKDMLNDSRFNNSQKHIIFLTDGGPQDDQTQYTALLDSLRDISVSTIALGRDGENDLDPEKVKAMVRVYNNRGAYYRVTNENQLDKVMLEDTEQAQSGDFVNEKPFTGIITTTIPALSAIGEMQPLNGYYGTRAKTAATVIVKTDTDDPLYVEWRPENSKGRVGSFTSDLNGRGDGFSKDFVTHFIGKAFMAGIVKSIMPTAEVINQQNISIGYTDQNYQSTIRIRTAIEEGETLRANVTTPDGKKTRIPLTSISQTTFSGMFVKEQIGVYTVEIIKYAKNGTMLSTAHSYSTFSYSQEYENTYDERDTIILMEEIAKAGEGMYLVSAENMFTKEAETVSETIQFTIPFIVISLFLFLLDIVVRKFKFKWPHELLRKKGLDGSQTIE